MYYLMSESTYLKSESTYLELQLKSTPSIPCKP